MARSASHAKNYSLPTMSPRSSVSGERPPSSTCGAAFIPARKIGRLWYSPRLLLDEYLTSLFEDD
jgi:hypothetical protein